MMPSRSGHGIMRWWGYLPVKAKRPMGGYGFAPKEPLPPKRSFTVTSKGDCHELQHQRVFGYGQRQGMAALHDQELEFDIQPWHQRPSVKGTMKIGTLVSLYSCQMCGSHAQRTYTDIEEADGSHFYYKLTTDSIPHECRESVVGNATLKGHLWRESLEDDQYGLITWTKSSRR